MPHDRFSSSFGLLFLCVFLGLRITTFCKKWSKVTPKGSQTEPKSPPNGHSLTSRNIWYLLYGSHIRPIRSTSGSTFFLHCFLDTVFLVDSCDFWDFGCQKGTPNGWALSPGEWPKIDSVAKSLQEDPEAPKGCPEIPKCHQKQPRIDDFATQESPKWVESFVVSENLQTAKQMGLDKKCEHSPLFGKTLRGEIFR